MVRLRNTYIPALIIALLVIGWVASGLPDKDDQAVGYPPSLEEQNQQLANSREDGPATRVRAQTISATWQTAEITVRGRTEANREVRIRAEVSGRVVALPLDRGAVVNKGDVICQLATEDRQARLEEAMAAVSQTKLEYDGVLSLASSGLQSDVNIAAAKTRLKNKEADLVRRRLEFKYTRIAAPFSGIIEELPVEIGDYLRNGDVCARLVDLNPIIVAGKVAELDIAGLKPGNTATATLLNGEQIKGTIRFASRDASTRTYAYDLEIEVPNPDMRIPGGLTASIQIPTRTYLAHRISPALLGLDDAGAVGVRILDNESRARFQKVQIIKEVASGIWVTGLPEVTRIITVGQELVTQGELVEVAAGPVSGMSVR